MRYTRLGTSGLTVSRISLGCMSFGDTSRGFNEWALDDDAANQPIAEAVQRVAEVRGVPMAQVALAWVLRNPVVAAPIVGATKAHHLADAVAALDVTLTDEEVGTLEAPYTPRLPTGY